MQPRPWPGRLTALTSSHSPAAWGGSPPPHAGAGAVGSDQAESGVGSAKPDCGQTTGLSRYECSSSCTQFDSEKSADRVAGIKRRAAGSTVRWRSAVVHQKWLGLHWLCQRRGGRLRGAFRDPCRRCSFKLANARKGTLEAGFGLLSRHPRLEIGSQITQCEKEMREQSNYKQDSQQTTHCIDLELLY